MSYVAGRVEVGQGPGEGALRRQVAPGLQLVAV